jgi:hypothetical protein
MKTFLVLIISLLAINACSKDFSYKETFTCSTEKPKDEILGGADQEPHYKYWTYYFFSISGNNDFVVQNDSKQYTNFVKTKYIQTYFQNGGITSAKFKKENGVEIYELIEENESETAINTFMLNKKAMTFTSRIRRGGKNYEPTSGVCYQHIANHKTK